MENVKHISIRIKNFFQKSVTKITITLSSLKFISICKICFGFYQDISSNVIIQICVKTYCFTYLLFNSIIQYKFILLHVNRQPFCVVSYGSFHTVQLTINSLIVLFTNEEYFANYCSGIRSIDIDLGLSNELSSYVCFIIISLLPVIEFEGGFFTWYTYGKSALLSYEYISSTTLFVSIIFLNFPRIMIFEWLYDRAKLLKITLKANLNDAASCVEKINRLQQIFRVYTKLRNNLKSTRNIVRLLSILGIVSSFWRIMLCIYYCMFYATTWISFHVTTWWIGLLCEMLMVWLPALLMELADNEIDEIKAILANHILESRDGQLRTALSDVLEYINGNPLTFTLWHNFPMNLNLFLGFFALITTYIIGLLQFKY